MHKFKPAGNAGGVFFSRCSSVAERRVHTPVVAGSIPTAPSELACVHVCGLNWSLAISK